jgi:hypothetical protein
MLWPNFYTDDLIRWTTRSIWHNTHAVASATHRRPLARRALPTAGILLAVLILIGCTALNPAVATVLSVLVTVLLLWSIAGLLVLHHAAPNPHDTRAARKVLRRDHHRSVEIINVARAPHGRHGAARDLMAQIAKMAVAEGREPVCIARSRWHQTYYASDGWAPATGLLCTWPQAKPISAP